MIDKSYEGYIIKSILQNASFGVGEVFKLQVVLRLQSYHQRVVEVTAILEKGRYHELAKLKDTPHIFDDLTIIKFQDCKQQEYYGIVYDSDELWQDPVVTRIFPYIG